MTYSFATQYLGSEWLQSGHWFETEREAIRAALAWVEISLENGLAVSVKIVRSK